MISILTMLNATIFALACSEFKEFRAHKLDLLNSLLFHLSDLIHQTRCYTCIKIRNSNIPSRVYVIPCRHLFIYSFSRKK